LHIINYKTLNPPEKPQGGNFVIRNKSFEPETRISVRKYRLVASEFTHWKTGNDPGNEKREIAENHEKRSPDNRLFANEYGRCPQMEVSGLRMGYKRANPNINFLYNNWSAEENSSNSNHQH